MKNIKKEILFENETKCTEKEYNIFIKVHDKEYAISELIYTIGYTIFLVFCGILLVLNKDLIAGIFVLCLGIAFFMYRNIHPKKLEKEQRKKIKQPIKNKYNFYNHYFETYNAEGNSTTFYFKIYKIIETNDSYYIYVNREFAFMVSKKGFVKGDVKSFTKFLKKKRRFKYRDRREKKENSKNKMRSINKE